MLRAGVIGLGVGERHIFGYEKDSRCRVVALCDFDLQRLAEVGARHPGKRLVSDASDILLDPNIDIVTIASFDNFHHEQIMTAFSRNKHVFVEKPLCLHPHELVDIRAAMSEKPELGLSSNLILRRAPRFIKLRNDIRAGLLGNIYHIQADYNYGRIHKLIDGWRGDIPYYSVVHGGAIHMIDLVMWLLNTRPVSVQASGTRVGTVNTKFKFNDCVCSLLEFQNGVLAQITANFSCVFPHHHNLTIYGTEATFVHDRLGARLYTSRDPCVKPIEVKDTYPGAEKGDMIPSFIKSILDGSSPDVSAQEVVDVMAVSLAIEEAAKSKKLINISYE